MEPENKLPYNEYYVYFGPDYTLHVDTCNMENLNTPKDMETSRIPRLLIIVIRIRIIVHAIPNATLWSVVHALFCLHPLKPVVRFRNKDNENMKKSNYFLTSYKPPLGLL